MPQWVENIQESYTGDMWIEKSKEQQKEKEGKGEGYYGKITEHIYEVQRKNMCGKIW